MEATAKRVPVVPAVAAFSTTDAIRQAGAFVDLGADSLIVILQTMFPLSRQEIEHYFETVARAVPCPIVLYTNPGLGTADLTPDMIHALSDVPNIRYVKDASGIISMEPCSKPPSLECPMNIGGKRLKRYYF